MSYVGLRYSYGPEGLLCCTSLSLIIDLPVFCPLCRDPVCVVLIVLGSVIQLPLVLSLAFGKSVDLFVHTFLKLHYWTLTLEVSQTSILITGVSSLIPSSSRIPTLPGHVANLLAIPALYSTLPIVVTFPLSLVVSILCYKEWLMAPVTPPLMPVVPPSSTYEVGGPSIAAAEGQSFTLPAPGFHVPPSVIEDLSTRMGNLEYGHGQLVKKVIQVSDAEVADDISIREIGPRVSTVEGQVEQGQQAVTQRDEVISGLSQQRDVQIQQLQTLVAKMSSRESTLM
ncbi:hypothetical protein Tco_0915571 [Tanacetum coccineum]